MTYKDLAAKLLGRGEGFLREIFPNGKVHGNTFKIGNIQGEAGDSLTIDMLTGAGYDHATNQGWHDYLSIYAGHFGIKNGEAFLRITGEPPADSGPDPIARLPAKAVKPKILPIPFEQEVWNPSNLTFGKRKPSLWWRYRDRKGKPLGFTARYDSPEGKEFTTWVWTDIGWRPQGFDRPRPAYGLELLDKNPTAHVIIVEGEKSCDAARNLCGKNIIVMSWPGGANAVMAVDWSHLAERNVWLWPDADEPGRIAMYKLGQHLKLHCTSVKLIETDKADGWDAADAVAEGWSNEDWKLWAKPLVKQVHPDPVAENAPTKIASLDAGSLSALWMRLGLELSGAQPACNLNNVVRVLQGLDGMKGRIWWDEFKRSIFSDWQGGKIEEWGNHSTIHLQLYMQSNIGLQKMLKQPVNDGVIVIARMNKRNPIAEFIDSLPAWDGQHRCEKFFVDCYGAPKSEYARKCGLNFWKSLAARAMDPGCKVDNMIVLEGAQGIKKSSSLRLIAGSDWYAEAQCDVGSKEFLEIIQGKLIIEISEMDAFNKADVSKVKQTITVQSDRFRVPYEPAAADHPRQCIFIGTVNTNDWNRDATGARRFWPIKALNIDLEMIAKWRFQLWAEAVQRVRAGEDWWDMPRDETLMEQAARAQDDLWMEPIAQYLVGRKDVRIAEIADRALEIQTGKGNLADTQRIGRCLKLLGWENSGQKRVNGAVVRVWTPTQKNAPVLEGQGITDTQST